MQKIGQTVIRALRDPQWGVQAGKTLVDIFHNNGIAGVRSLLRSKYADYSQWIRLYEPPPADYQKFRDKVDGWKDPPLISVIMPVYNTPKTILRSAVESVCSQVYPRWELCIADDASTKSHVRKLLEHYSKKDDRIRVVYREKNGHISAASNSALVLATGSHVAFLDHDDMLHPLALYFLAEAIQRCPEVGLIYTDEDKINLAGKRFAPYFKCDLNYELLLAHNMITHLACYRRNLLSALGGFRAGFEGAQDYDLALRMIEVLTPEEIVHIPRVLYHWRMISGSTARNSKAKPYAHSAARKAIEEHLRRRGLKAKVSASSDIPGCHRVQFALPDPQPKVNIIIPTRDRADLVKKCVESIRVRTSYLNYEIIIVDNHSTEQETLRLFDRLRKSNIRILRDDLPFNFSRLNNRAAASVQGSFLCLMNNDIEIITPQWLEEMVSFAALDDVGAVGARLWYPDGSLQHGGVILGIGGIAGHSHRFFRKAQVGHAGRMMLHQSFSAVTAACLVIRKRIFDEMGGFDEKLSVAFNDVDLCLRIRQAGYRNVWTPYAEMVHHESATRGYENTSGKVARFERERKLMQQRWGDLLLNDPAYSPNLTLNSEDFAMAWPPRVSYSV